MPPLRPYRGHPGPMSHLPRESRTAPSASGSGLQLSLRSVTGPLLEGIRGVHRFNILNNRRPVGHRSTPVCEASAVVRHVAVYCKEHTADFFLASALGRGLCIRGKRPVRGSRDGREPTDDRERILPWGDCRMLGNLGNNNGSGYLLLRSGHRDAREAGHNVTKRRRNLLNHTQCQCGRQGGLCVCVGGGEWRGRRGRRGCVGAWARAFLPHRMPRFGTAVVPLARVFGAETVVLCRLNGSQVGQVNCKGTLVRAS